MSLFGVVSRSGVKIKITDLTEKEKKLIQRELTVSPLTLDELFPKKFKIFKSDKEYVYVPRYWAKETLERLVTTEDFGNIVPMNLKFNGTLRKELEQDKATDALLKSLKNTGGGILSLDTGYGKTFCSIYIAVKLHVKTMILVHKTFLADQFEESIRKLVPEAKISKIRGDECDISGDFVICMIQTLLSRKYDAFEGIGCLITDESHHVPAESFSRAMFGISFKYTIGLSATPTRRDGLSRVMFWFLGPLAYEARRSGQSHVNVKIMHFDHNEYQKPPPINRRGDLCYTSLITKICDIHDRTQFIAEQTKRISDTGRSILVLSHRRGHAMAICEILKTLGVDAETYLGGDKIAPDTQVIIATYSLASEGFDCPRLNALVLATPSSNVVQAVGRILRGGRGNDPIIIDIVDKYSLFYSQLAKRKTIYKKIGFTILGEEDKKSKKREEKIEEKMESMFLDDD
ncbi:ATP-dependent RNA helicase [Paramecium bursaria Chlorella virus NY2B]|uniref:ATP-dependent RNA helicase n=1 Tax=Paramecium bursaria Chlorella virus NYs1 TaxID=83442 RepID=M1I330_9PHYC|nr:ATP-dependent RNA helicase [Paramecium bursaria Chlorella virus NYs1]AGE58266.1 ATP-dependent RNA helicase [Paramecium bursaria Chlorella virus NY2B]AGE58637.1 ATP-dependent RNA helicase [Paramecium bursaria Chlorella virus NYs1]